MVVKAKNIDQSKCVPKSDSERPLSDSLGSALKLIDYLTTPTIDLDEDRSKDSLSAPDVPTCLRQLSVVEVKQILNTQIPKKWRKQISEVVW